MFSLICHNPFPHVTDFKALDCAIAIVTKQICNVLIFGASAFFLHSLVSKRGLKTLRSVNEYYLHVIMQVFNKLNHNKSKFKKHAFFTPINTVKKWCNKK